METSSPLLNTIKPKPLARADKHIWGIFIALCLISVIELYSASSREVASSSIGVVGPILRHLMMLGAGALLTWFIARRHYSDVVIFTVVFSVISAVAMIYVMFCGNYVNGARRSFSLLGIGVFPAEMVKISAVLLIALVMSLNQDKKNGGITLTGVMWSGVIIIFFSGLLIEQGLTNTLLLLAITYSMMVISGVRWRHMFAMTGFFLLCGLIFGLYLYFTEVRGSIAADASQNVELTEGAEKTGGSRIATWMARVERHNDDKRPKWELEPTGINRQEVLSYWAQAHGGIHGVGPGNSREAARLPLAFSDYIFAIVVEELGLIGGIAVVVLYLWLLARAAGIASRCSITYPALIGMGMAVMIAFQALFHIAIVTGIFPVSGQPLPLISKGGTSIIVTCIAFGIMLSVSRTATRTGNKKQDISEEKAALPEQLREENSMQL
ncbi:MAG: FtsW/RodA/SpoVE family cell cycle protein [Bacteroides sp.]|nr:FtsW/RodA/SpoVE family cell cycle protein [Bacteroides sp.]MBD5332419.1 FtsW/RodA/SpoVE family cell cycle protein [Bacteroides sp.]